MPTRAIAHPEHRAGPAQRDRHRDPGDIATADPPAHGYQQRLARRNGIRIVRLVLARENAEHALEIAKLHEPATEGEEQAHYDEERYERPPHVRSLMTPKNLSSSSMDTLL